MKILLIIILYHVSGPVLSADVSVYTGGTVLINYKYDPSKYNKHTRFFCRLNDNRKCNDKILLKASDIRLDKGRLIFMKTEQLGLDQVVIRHVNVQDKGTYSYGVEPNEVKPTDISMEVEEDPRFGQTQTHTAHPGENLTFTCTYPDKYKDLLKFLHRETNHSLSAVIHPFQDPAQRGRFLFSDYSQKKHFTVSIRDMRKEDGGVYLCGIQEKFGGTTVFSFFSEIQLHVTDPAEKPSDSSIIIITVCVGGTLMLIGGLALIYYKLRKNAPETSPSREPNRNKPKDPALVSLQSSENTNQSDSVYQSLDPNTNQSDSVYQSLDPNTNQSDSVYQSLDPNTNQSDSVYQSLDPNTNQSDSAHRV
ncbi:polymeric immunoglobulin receptor-like isoform X2 [Hoplias malabaricus]|uniref:polymeric immunoglobulin receptor-like isoform X2 n=1 Tax=Hoplias malabaricus TaxID=27720 RepID=UPI003461A19A